MGHRHPWHSAPQGYKPAKLVLTVHFIPGFREIKERVGWDPGQTWGEGRPLEQGEPGQRSLSSAQEECLGVSPAEMLQKG